MATVKPDVFKVIQVYGGLKAGYFEVDTIAAGDVIDFSDDKVSGIKMCVLQNATDGNAEKHTVSGSSVTLDAASTATSVKGIVCYRAY